MRQSCSRSNWITLNGQHKSLSPEYTPKHSLLFTFNILVVNPISVRTHWSNGSSGVDQGPWSVHGFMDKHVLQQRAGKSFSLILFTLILLVKFDWVTAALYVVTEFILPIDQDICVWRELYFTTMPIGVAASLLSALRHSYGKFQFQSEMQNVAPIELPPVVLALGTISELLDSKLIGGHSEVENVLTQVYSIGESFI